MSPKRILRASAGLYRRLAGWLQLRIPDKLTCLPFVPLGLGGRAEPQECSGLGAKSLTNTQRQLRSLLPLGGNGQSSTAVDLDEATEMVWLSSQE